MELDFSALNNLGSENGTADQPKDEPSTGVTHRLEREREELEEARRVFAEYQKNIRQAERYTSDIAKELKEGKPLAYILLKALKCISLLTGDEVLYTQSKEEMQTVYGWGLHDPALLQVELKEARGRLEMLTRPELAEGHITGVERSRIQTAIRATEELINQLTDEINGISDHQ